MRVTVASACGRKGLPTFYKELGFLDMDFATPVFSFTSIVYFSNFGNTVLITSNIYDLCIEHGNQTEQIFNVFQELESASIGN